MQAAAAKTERVGTAKREVEIRLDALEVETRLGALEVEIRLENGS